MKAGDIYTVAGHKTGTGFSGDGGPAVKAALGRFIDSVRVDRSGNLVLAATQDNRIRVVAASQGMFYGIAMKPGNIYTVAGTGTAGFSGNGGPAIRAKLARPSGVALDPAGNLVIADTDSNRIRVVAARTGTFYGRPMKAGDIYTLAGTGTAGFSGDGGPATGARLRRPAGVAVDDSTGAVLIADSGNNRVRAVAVRTGTFYGQPMKAKHIYTVAGTGTSFLLR